MLLIATTPVIFEHGTIGYADLPFACYLVLSVLWYVRANKEGRAGSYVLSGILLGLACWTRPERLVIGIVVALALLTARRLSSEGQVRHAAWLLPAALIGGAWQVFAALYAGGGQISQAIVFASQAIAQGDLHASAFYWIARFLVRQALSPSAWGVLLPLAVVVVVMRSRELWRRWDPALVATFAAAAALGIGMVGFYYLVSFVGDLAFWLGTGVDRMFLPAGILAAIWVIQVADLGSRPTPLSRGPLPRGSFHSGL